MARCILSRRASFRELVLSTQVAGAVGRCMCGGHEKRMLLPSLVGVNLRPAPERPREE